MPSLRDVVEALLEDLRAGRRLALATVVRSSGSTPRAAGARMLVRPDGSTVGTIGGGLLEAKVIDEALAILAEGDAGPRLRRYTLTDEGPDALGMVCGGTAEVFLEPVGRGPRLVVFGAGHVGVSLGRLAGSVGFHVQIVDDRESFCEAARRAGVGEVHRCDPDYGVGVPAIDETCFVAVVTRGHRTDRLALRQVAGRTLRYVGLIGSRRKKETIFRELVSADGVDAAWLESVRCPIGLPLGGDTPEEIAVSIVAELLQERHRRPGGGPPTGPDAS